MGTRVPRPPPGGNDSAEARSPAQAATGATRGLSCSTGGRPRSPGWELQPHGIDGDRGSESQDVPTDSGRHQEDLATERCQWGSPGSRCTGHVEWPSQVCGHCTSVQEMVIQGHVSRPLHRQPWRGN